MEDIILYFANKYFGDWERIFDALEKQEDIDFEELEELKENMEGQYITVLSDEYPSELRSLDRPPFVLWVKGRKELLAKGKKVWYYGNYYDENYEVIGEKHYKEAKRIKTTLITGYSSNFERTLVNKLDIKDAIIIRDSGIDSYINMTKLEERHLMKSNVIVSEYPGKYIPSLHSWEQSNRIKGGLSVGIVLLNSINERQMFKTIFNVLDIPRPVYCYDGDVDKKSHNQMLISKGGCAINKLKEIKNG